MAIRPGKQRAKKQAAPGTYRATRRIYDTVNGIEIFAGELVQTSEIAWIERFGSGFESVLSYGDSESVRVVEGTAEARGERRSNLRKPDKHKPKPEPEVEDEVPEATDKAEGGEENTGFDFTRAK